ncbi:MAG: polymer-forming cytoskeletal protein [Spirochaetia bacterium]|nr:polymer-forming cytoskeletal protein [Spirochaetales bacterium]MDX9784160.1 polymer-forming cytoskeletal protein [Spirochaetia bacterium]
MKRRGNFSKAVEELIGLKQSDEGNAEEQSATSLGEEEVRSSSGVFAEGSQDFSGRFGLSGGALPTVWKPESSSPLAVVTQDMVIKGSIQSQANILIEGTVQGDVLSEGDILLRGKIEGNLNLRSLLVEGGSIDGDIVSSSAVVLEANSLVRGNIKAERVEIDGSVTGNLESATKIVLKSQALIEGNIKAKELAIHEGAELKGNVNVHKA